MESAVAGAKRHYEEQASSLHTFQDAFQLPITVSSAESARAVQTYMLEVQSGFQTLAQLRQ